MRRLLKVTPLVLAAVLALTACESGESNPPETSGDTSAASDATAGPTESGRPFIPAPEGDTLAFDLLTEPSGGWDHTASISWAAPGSERSDWMDYLPYLPPDASSLTVKVPAEFAALAAGQTVELYLYSLTIENSNSSSLSFATVATSDSLTFDFGGTLTSLGVAADPVRGSESTAYLSIDLGEAGTGKPYYSVSAFFQFDPAASGSIDLSWVDSYASYGWSENANLYGVRWGQSIELRIPAGPTFQNPWDFYAALSPQGDGSEDFYDRSEGCEIRWNEPGEGDPEMSLSADRRVLTLPLPAAGCDFDDWYLFVDSYDYMETEAMIGVSIEFHLVG